MTLMNVVLGVVLALLVVLLVMYEKNKKKPSK